ncbi:helix-turn-helix domain-containing protein [Kineococcus sp. GCM10028916]|uniref:helix-turn-helix domain-containing protein n=1 Tax=Kineococcus sp. GCM10028916 TaxID=3273394 RepID=UPI00364579CC
MTVDELPGSWVAARRALRLTAEGTATDPGPRIVHAEAVQGLLLLAAAVPAGAPPVPDVGAVERAAVLAPWMLRTLDVLATTSSRRAAATELAVHHSTVQARVLTAQRALGWELQDVAGLQRLQLALVLRRLHRTP